MSSKLYIDVRSHSEVPKKLADEVISYPYTKILKDKELFCKRCEEADEIVLICRSGSRSSLARSILMDCGVENIEIKTPKEVKEILNGKK